MPSSLTTLLPPALGFSPHPPVSVYGTGTYEAIAAFLDGSFACFPTMFRSASHLPFDKGIFLLTRYLACTGLSIPGSRFCLRVPTVLFLCGAGISTCCPSATPFSLALGPDSPRADQLYPGNLGYSAWRILTSISLLIPAFSLLNSPLLLPVQLLRVKNAPLPIY